MLCVLVDFPTTWNEDFQVALSLARNLQQEREKFPQVGEETSSYKKEEDRISEGIKESSAIMWHGS